MSTEQDGKPEDLEAILDEIVKLEEEHGSLGICFSKVSDFLPSETPEDVSLCMTAEFAGVVRDIMISGAKAINIEAPTLEPVVDLD